ncbi:DMT family transporter [Undibacterium griseum]|uniref:DMT family transporter n=1 Tax=Undibacterium griseum TaxID=2762295 RepID=A0ABR6YIK1_9BURK|nr:DMT family transporter [Undibacterium griseum]MBC3883737.1 DMT family transporter [Undibacterium griseum]
MFNGVMAALGAGLLWGLVFITPLLLPDYPGLMLSFGRYFAFGLIALFPAWLDRHRIRQLRRQDWISALKLVLIGNIIYYAALASAIQLADAPLPTMLIGTLPVVIAVCANWSPHHPSEAIAWKKLLFPLLLIFSGIMLVNGEELQHLDHQRNINDYVKGTMLALVAVAAWTWYPIMNSRFLKNNPHIPSGTWATVQGLATLPLALAGLVGYGLLHNQQDASAFQFPLGSTPEKFVLIMLMLGLLASWLGTLLWNYASQKLATSLSGQLIVFETLAALSYAFALRQTLPAMPILAGVILLCTGVAFALREFRTQPH